MDTWYIIAEEHLVLICWHIGICCKTKRRGYTPTLIGEARTPVFGNTVAPPSTTSFICTETEINKIKDEHGDRYTARAPEKKIAINKMTLCHS